MNPPDPFSHPDPDIDHRVSYPDPDQTQTPLPLAPVTRPILCPETPPPRVQPIRDKKPSVPLMAVS
jgi:hypothetical protein